MSTRRSGQGGSFGRPKGLPWAVFAVLIALAPAAQAQGILAHIRQTGTLTCAAESRPGFAEADEQGQIHGLAVDLCRAVAIAVLGPTAAVRVTLPDADNEYAPLAKGAADIAFLSAPAMAQHGLIGPLIPGPTVFIDPIALMVPVKAAAHTPADLGGTIVCLMTGSRAQRALEAALGSATPPIGRLAFREDAEMQDTYNVGECGAVVGDATSLAEMRLSGGVNHLQSRLLSPPLALTPFVATTPTSDGAWAALVGWVVHGLVADSAPPSPWRPRTPLSPSGLRPHWQDEVHTALGTYNDMRERSLGSGSPLKLPAWPNAAWPNGLLVPPAAE